MGMAGATKETYQAWEKAVEAGTGVTLTQFVNDLTQKNGEAFAEALGLDGPANAQFVNGMISHNRDILELYLFAQHEASNYHMESKKEDLISATTSADGVTTLKVNYWEAIMPPLLGI